jgi:hypothetical protein
MLPFTATAFFCEDIRHEQGDTNSLVGIMPDNISGAPEYPALLPKLGIYVRINFDPNDDPGSIEMVLVRANGEEQRISKIQRQLIEKTIGEAKRDGNPVAGIITRAIIAPFPITEAGRMRVFARLPKGDVLAGSLNVLPATSAT